MSWVRRPKLSAKLPKPDSPRAVKPQTLNRRKHLGFQDSRASGLGCGDVGVEQFSNVVGFLCSRVFG